MQTFSAQYEGPTEIYTMPLAGGLPARRTFDGGNDRVVGWTPDGGLLYATEVFSTLPNWQLVRLDPQTDQRRPLPLAQASLEQRQELALINDTAVQTAQSVRDIVWLTNPGFDDLAHMSERMQDTAALNGLARGSDFADPAFTVASLKRALDHLHKSQAGLAAVAPKNLLPEKMVAEARKEMFEIRGGILQLMNELRGRK